MRTLLVAIGAMGAAVGVVQVIIPAYADARGTNAIAGLLLAALSAGSLIGGVVYGARAWPGTPAARLPVLLLASAPVSRARPGRRRRARGPPLLARAAAPPAMVGSTLLDIVVPGHVTEAFSVT